jgi:hypothetical protein
MAGHAKEKIFEVKNYTAGTTKKKPRDSHFLSGLMKVKETFLSPGRFHLNDGHNIRFWKDK